MSFLDSLKLSAESILTATSNALHAQLANTLSQAGHPVSEDDHVDTLVSTALGAAVATNVPAATAQAPNYADHALATFSTSMTAAMIQFAQAFLPAKFQGVAAAATSAAATVVNDVKSGNVAAIVNDVAGVASSVVAAVAPEAAPLVAAAKQIAKAVTDNADSATDVVDNVKAVAAAAAAAAATSAAQAAIGAGLAALTNTVAAATGTQTGESGAPAVNTQGV
jgi:hypothetical protein